MYGAALSTGALSLVVDELEDVADPHKLGINLGIHPAKVNILLSNASGIERQKSDIIEFWLNNDENPSWSTLIKTIRNIGHGRLARKLKIKYNIIEPPKEVRESEEDEFQGKKAEIMKSEKDARIEYGRFIFRACKLMEEKQVYLPDVKLTWSAYDSEMSDEACQAKDIKTFLMAIRENQGPYAYENISGLLTLFCNHEGEELVAEYEKKLKGKLLKRVSPVKRVGKRFKVKIDKELSRENIFNFINTLAKLFDCEPTEFILEDIRDRCIELTYIISAELAEHIQIQERLLHDKFKDLHITTIWIERQMLWIYQPAPEVRRPLWDIESAQQRYQSHSNLCWIVIGGFFALLVFTIVTHKWIYYQKTSSHDTVDSRDLIQETSPTTANDVCSRNYLYILMVVMPPTIITIFSFVYKWSFKFLTMFFYICHLILLHIYGHFCLPTSYIYSNVSVYILYLIYCFAGCIILLCLKWLNNSLI